MTISSVKTGAIGDSLLAGNAAFNPSSYESIATATGTGSSGTITFSSIPATYSSLQVRYSLLMGAAGDNVIMRFNSDSGANYTRHILYGTGSAVTASGSTGVTSIGVGSYFNGAATANPNVGIIDIHNYASTTQNKTVRTIAGIDLNGSGDIDLTSGLWINTAAVSTVTLSVVGNTFSTGSTFSLYGIKGA